MNLVILERAEVRNSGVVDLSGPRAAHLLKVLRVGLGDSVRVGILDGARGTGVVESVVGGVVVLRCAFDAVVMPRPRIDVLLALPRPKVMRRLWAQIAALGVGQIILTNAERVERQYFDTHVIAPDCYRPLLIEGLQQARDTRLPGVSVHRRLKVLVEDELDGLFGFGRRLVADPGTDRRPVTGGWGPIEDRALLAIGPEGGWNAFEVGLLEAHGFEPIGMGPRTLRTDTACIALLALAQASLSADRPVAG